MSEGKNSIAIIGSGNWASILAINVGRNVVSLPDFEPRVNMFVYEEMVDNKKLSEIINTTHVNVKYLPNQILPDNVVAVPSVIETAKNADIIIFAIPSSFVINICKSLLGKIKATAIAISAIKGFEKTENGQIILISQYIQKSLKIPCSVIFGCNLAYELTRGKFCEATIGYRDPSNAKLLRNLFQSDNLRIELTKDVECAEMCATLKNIIAFSSGCADGLNLNENTKTGLIRRGFLEIINFVDIFYPGTHLATLFRACGFSDLIVVCHANRNRKLAEAFVKSGKSLAELQNVLITSQEPLGPAAAAAINVLLRNKNMEDKFPLLTTIHKICIGEESFMSLVDTLRFAREDIYHPINTLSL